MKRREIHIEVFRKILPEGIAERAIIPCEEQGWPKFDPDTRLRWLIDSFEWTKTPEGWDYWHEVSLGNFIVANDLVPSSQSHNYRALYEQEKALKEALLAILRFDDPLVYDPIEKMKAMKHYQQLKQQYNGTINTSNT